MTHTLHRQGSRESLSKDYVVLAIPAKGYNTPGSGEKLRQIKQIMAEHSPVNIGDIKIGNMYSRDISDVVAHVQDGTVIHAVYRDIDTLSAVLGALKEADTGISIVVSGLFDHVAECCKRTGLEVHTTEFSLGVHGNVKRLPEPEVTEISTMCGHGMVAFGLIKQLAARVRHGKVSAEEAGKELARQCVCGIVNPARAAELLVKMAK